MNPFKQRQFGFSLVELMVVMVIVVMLMGILVPVVRNAREKARGKQVLADMTVLQQAIQTFRSENGKWPAQVQGATDDIYVVNNYMVVQPLLGDNPRSHIYLSVQLNQFDAQTNFIDPWGTPYVIAINSTEDQGILCATNFTYVYSSSNSIRREKGLAFKAAVSNPYNDLIIFSYGLKGYTSFTFSSISQ